MYFLNLLCIAYCLMEIRNVTKRSSFNDAHKYSFRFMVAYDLWEYNFIWRSLIRHRLSVAWRMMADCNWWMLLWFVVTTYTYKYYQMCTYVYVCIWKCICVHLYDRVFATYIKNWWNVWMIDALLTQEGDGDYTTNERLML